MTESGLIGTLNGISQRQEPPAPGRLRVTPLGGVGEFGKNCMAIECGEDMILVDCGLKFPEDEMLGIDKVIPDFSYVIEHAERLRGIVLTHGHEDHIGAVAFLARQLGPARTPPIYGSPLTLALVASRLAEMPPDQAPALAPVRGHERARLGTFEIEFLPVAHSMPEAMALSIDTPAGRLFHTGDYKMDEGAADSPMPAPFNRLDLDRPCLMLMADSTNVDREGFSPLERDVAAGMAPLVAGADGTVVVATFSSSLHRVRTVLELARQCGRKVAVCGLSLERNYAIATELGLLEASEELVRPLSEVVRMAPEQRLLMFTGTQGEPESALARLSRDAFRGYRIQPGDLVILSSRIIPGNERRIWRMVDHFYRHGARVTTERDAMVHGSGHAYRGEMRRLLELMRPRYFMPIHGEARQLILHRDLAIQCGVNPDRVLVVDNGVQVELSDGEGAIMTPTGWAGQVMVDGRVMDGVEEVVLRDRRHLSADGMLTVILVIDTRTRRIIAGPDIVSRGFVCMDGNEPLIEECKEVVIRTFEQCDLEGQEEWDTVKTSLRKALRRFLSLRTDRYPVILPVVVEI